jgi:hypothetical protein
MQHTFCKFHRHALIVIPAVRVQDSFGGYIIESVARQGGISLFMEEQCLL